MTRITPPENLTEDKRLSYVSFLTINFPCLIHYSLTILSVRR
jgi:hypothetical protein